MNKKILFIVPMVALVLAGCNTRNTSSSSTNPTSGGTDTSATTTGGTTTGGSATSATTGGTTTGGSSTTGTSTTGTSTTQTVIPVTEVWVESDRDVALKVGGTSQINAHVNPENATDQGLIYTPDNKSVATVSDTGLITGVGAGSTTVTVAAHGDPSKSKTINVSVSDFTIPTSTSDGFTLLKSGDTLNDDDEVYFAGLNDTTMYTMNKYSSGTYVPSSVGAINNNVLTVGDGAEKYTIESGTAGFYFKDSSSNYLYADGEGSSDNWLKTKKDKSDTCLFAVSSDSDGISTVETSACTHGSVRFNYNNGTNPRFSAYDPSKTKLPKVNIYVKHAVKKDLQSIAVSGERTEYMQGDTFEKPTVTATFSVGDPEDVTDEAVFSGYDLSKTGSQTVEVSYTYKGVTKTTSYGINVAADTLNSISINGDMTKKTYNLNDAWDPSGLTFVGHYTSGNKTISPELTYNPETANSTELTQVEVTATLSGVSGSKTITGISVVSKSSMQIAYEVARDMSDKTGNPTNTTYTFTGVVTAVVGNSYFVQDGIYGMYVYNTTNAGGATVGKNVSVTAYLCNYNGVIETYSKSKDTEHPAAIITVTGDGILPSSSLVNSSNSLAALNQSILCHSTLEFVSVKGTDVWSSNKNGIVNFKFENGDPVVVKFDKFGYDAEKASILSNAEVGQKFNLSGILTTVNNDVPQFEFAGTSIIETKADPITVVSIKTRMRTEYVAGQYLDPSDLVITVSHESGATEDVAYAGHESDFEFDPSLTTVLTTEHTELVITYKGIDLDPVTLTVVEKTIVSATIKTQPSKREYNEGETFDPSGLVLTVTYDDESTDEVVYTSLDEGFEFDPDLDTPLTEDVSVSVTYVDKSAGSVAITVSAKPQTAYTRVSSNLSDWSGTYLLAYDVDDSNAKLWTGVDTVDCFVDAATDNGVISEVPSGAVTLTIAPMTGGYSVMVNGGDNDGKFIYGKKDDNKLLFGDTGQLNTLSYDDDGDGVLIISNTSVMRYNTTSGQNRFRYIKSKTYTGQKIVQLYKLG